MGENLPHSLDYAVRDTMHEKLADDVVKEYGYQIGKWKQYINRVVDAEREAVKNHQDVLQQIRSNQQADAMFAMLALSIVAGPALSWIGGALQYKVFPKYFSTIKTRLVVAGYRGPVGTFSEREHNKVMAKVFGDAGANLSEILVVNPVISSLVPEVKARGQGASDSALADFVRQSEKTSLDTSLQSLKTVLENAMEDEMTETLKTINSLADWFKESTAFSTAVLKYLYHRQPNLRQRPLGEQEREARKLIIKIVDYFRRAWAKQWYYYGYDPTFVSIRETSLAIEREIWAFWILAQEFKLWDLPVANLAVPVGKDEVPLGEPILKRLADLHVVLPRTTQQHTNLVTAMMNNPNLKIPVTNIKGAVDTKRELAEIISWANNHPPEFIPGADGYGRILGSVTEVHGQL